MAPTSGGTSSSDFAVAAASTASTAAAAAAAPAHPPPASASSSGGTAVNSASEGAKINGPTAPIQPPATTTPQFFASVGANRATVYKIGEDGSLSIAQAYVDEDAQETLYACTWTTSVANTPLLCLGGFRGLVKVVDCQNGLILTTLVGHGNAINELRTHPVSPALVLSASKDESIRLWNVYTSCCIAIFAGDQGHRDEVLSLDVHLLGNAFASCGMDNTVKIWSLDGPKLRRNIDRSYSYNTWGGHGGAGTAVGGTARANQMASDSGALTTVLDAADGANLEQLVPGTNGRIIRQRNGKNPLHGRTFQTIYEQFPLFSTAKVHSDYVDCVRWVGNLLVSKSTANKVVMWKPDVFALYGHSGIKGSWTTVSSSDGSGAEGALSVADSSGAPGSGGSAGAMGSGSTVGSGASGTPGAVVVLREFEFRDAEIWFVRFALDPALQILAVGNKYGKLWLWNVDGTPQQPLVKNASHAKCTSAVRQVSFSPDRRYLLCCCEDGSIWKWALDFA